MFFPQKIERNKKFLFQKISDNKARFDITDVKNTEKLGKAIATTYSEISIKGIYITGLYHSGKTVLSTNIIWGLGQTRKTFYYKSGVPYRVAEGNPKIYLVDYGYFDSTKKHIAFRWHNDKIDLNDNELIIGEYYEKIPETWLEKDRIEIEIINLKENDDITSIKTINQNIGGKKIVSMIGYGKGREFVEKLKETYFSNDISQITK